MIKEIELGEIVSINKCLFVITLMPNSNGTMKWKRPILKKVSNLKEEELYNLLIKLSTKENARIS